jgi:DNA-binding CsgD family transcriptional regulator
MANNSGRAKKIDLGNATWISLLSRCIDSIGGDQFSDNLLGALKSITDFDYSVSFAYHQNEKPICLFHTFTPGERVVFVDDYLKGPYLLDPFFKAWSEYYRSYYVRTGLAEEICYIFYLLNDVAIAISLMRSGESQRFSAREFRLLESVASIVSSLAQRHWQAVPDWFETDASKREPDENPAIIENTVGAIFGSRITPRETQVVAQVLEGHSSESIAKSLGISTGTVRIHRRNIYAKLDISSQQELFSIFFQKIKTVRA